MLRFFSLLLKRHRLKGVNSFIIDLEDQVQSGQASLRYYKEKRAQLEGQINALESSRDILRGMGA